MLKNKRNREKIQQRQHLRDRDPHTTNSDVHVLQHTVNIETVQDQLPGTRGVHGSVLPHGVQYNHQKTSPYQQNPTASVHSSGSGEPSRHQRYLPQRTHEHVVGAGSYAPNTAQQQPPIQGRISNSAQNRGSNSTGSAALAPNGGDQEATRSSSEKRGLQKPHRPGMLKARFWNGANNFNPFHYARIHKFTINV